MADTEAAGERRLSVVLPARNEVGLLGATVTALCAGLDDRGVDYEVVVVENGSTDGTLRLARVLAAQLEGVRVLSLPVGDYGAALAAGIAAARGTVVACYDVDYYDLAFLDAALRAIDETGADVVVASKRAPGARDHRPLVRRLLSGGFTTLTRLLLGREATDAHGMKVLVAERVAPVAGACTMRGSLFDVELVLRATRGGLRLVEIPATVAERRPPRTSVWSRAIESFLGILRLRRRLGGPGPGGRHRLVVGTPGGTERGRP